MPPPPASDGAAFDGAASEETVPTADAPSSHPAAVGLDPERFDAAVDLLVARDDHLAAAVAAHGRPGYWSRPATFATMVLFILEQQVSLASGKAVFDRLRALVGEVVPPVIAATPTGALRDVGMTRQKASYVTGLAEGILVGSVDWTSIVTGDRAAARQALLAVRGIGPWTADVWLLACRGFPDEWPIGDRALQVGVGEVVGASAPLTGDDLVATGTRWAPHRSTAARLVWHAYLSDRSRAETVVVGLDP